MPNSVTESCKTRCFVLMEELSALTHILSKADTVNLVGRGLAVADAVGMWARDIYAWTYGHPYLTQRLGALLEDRYDGGGTLAPNCVADSVEHLLRLLRRALDEQGLLDVAQALLDEHPRFSRLDENLARLELLGVATEREGHWAVRNWLLENALQEW